MITTAQVPGRHAPLMLEEAAVRGMKLGAVIVDLAAPTGGNTAFTKPGEEVVVGGVTILAPLNLAAEVPFDASQLYARNGVNFVVNMVKKGELQLDADDEIVRETLVTHAGEVVHPRVRELLNV